MVRKRKDCHGNRNGGVLRDKPIQRNAANARERARMRVLSKAFSRLKTTLPWVPPDTKLSKLDTLRLAASYIAHLRQILSTDDEQQGPNIHPLNLTWPFTFSAIKPHDSSGEANEDEIEDEEDEGEEDEDEEEGEDEDDVEHMECNGDTGNAMAMMNGNNTMLNNYSYYPII